ncbi:hypothetical protein [Cerasicoccus maritimus]|uniref:hypothetical protein n=1 Tax=Cerasicoccus maritimus TaxID=490089 RepID=UPI002852C7A7|nr:hypothetical protein [Cerasicoccus maritimus]
MNLRLIITSMLAALSAFSLNADTVFTASHAYTLTGKPNTNGVYGAYDHAHFEAGDSLVLMGTGWAYQETVTAKGIAIFDLEKDNLREQLKAAGENKLMLSVLLDQVEGAPRPLRIFYIGTTNDITTSRSLKAQFQRQPIHRINRALDKNAQPGVKTFDVTPLFGRELTDRYMVIRFEQEGERRELHSKDGATVTPDLYDFRNSADSVRLTITDQKDPNAVANQYSEDGYYAPIQDMSNNPTADMPKDLTSDMPANPIQDMSSNPTSDMPENILSDMPKNLINDGTSGNGDSM